MAAALLIDEVRQHVTTELMDDALERVIDACQADIDRWAGPLVYTDEEAEPITETVYAYGRTLLTLSQEPLEVTSITDIDGTTEAERAADTDWIIRTGSIERLGGYRWGTRTRVVYTPADSRTLRMRALLQLVQLELNHAPGLSSQRVGDWSMSTMPGSVTYEQERARILRDLSPQELFA